MVDARRPDEADNGAPPARQPAVGDDPLREFAVRARAGRLACFPLPGSGNTMTRFAALAATAGEDLSLGRLVEGHVDAVAILAEAGQAPRGQTAYGVWAAKSAYAEVRAERHGSRWLLSGTKLFCSGARACDRALVTAQSDDGDVLFDVDLHQPGVHPEASSWPSVGMAGSDSGLVRFDRAVASDEHQVGRTGFYTSRPGFWHGGIGVAACWYGGARALVDDTLASGTAGEAELAQLGTAVATVEALWALLAQAAGEIDDDPSDRCGRARLRALTVRHAVYTGCLTVLASVNGAGGARPWCLDADQSRRAADLYAYLAQHHPGRDGARLARLSAEQPLRGGPRR